MAVLLALGLLLGQVADVPVDDDTPDAPPPTPYEYLYANYPAAMARRLDCMITLESRWQPGAIGAGGLYVGLAQFDTPTWYETPQGQAGASRWDPYASIDAMAWGAVHLGWRRWPVTSRRC